MGDETKDRPYMGMGVLSGGDTAAGTTIVGGQPDGSRRGVRQRVPVGLERVLCAAAADPELKAALLADRKAAVAARGFGLSPSENAVLENLPVGQLDAMIARLDVSRENLARREFLRAVAGTVVALAAGTALDACSGNDGQAGAQGDAPFLGPYEKAPEPSAPPVPPQPPFVDPGPPAGIRPDLPEPPRPMPTAGVRPDVPDIGEVPQPRPNAGARPNPRPHTIQMDEPEPHPTRGIRPDIP
jgi:hypothetical protein